MGRHTLSASSGYLPYSYEQKPIEDRLTCTWHACSSSHASAAPDYRPMNNIEYSIDQHGTLHRLEDVSRFYPSVVDSQSARLSLNRPMGEGIGLASTSCLAGYSQPAYTAPYLTTESATYATDDISNSAYLLGDGRISEDSAGAHMPDYNTMA